MWKQTRKKKEFEKIKKKWKKLKCSIDINQKIKIYLKFHIILSFYDIDYKKWHQVILLVSSYDVHLYNKTVFLCFLVLLSTDLSKKKAWRLNFFSRGIIFLVSYSSDKHVHLSCYNHNFFVVLSGLL